MVSRLDQSSREKALSQLAELQHAPSVGMHDVPRQSVSEHLGLNAEDIEAHDELDEHIARRCKSWINSSVS
jgi:histone deacetylase 1/2